MIVERKPTGELRTLESWDNTGPVGMAGGSLIGMLVGVLGGPVVSCSAGAPAPRSAARSTSIAP